MLSLSIELSVYDSYEKFIRNHISTFWMKLMTEVAKLANSFQVKFPRLNRQIPGILGCLFGKKMLFPYRSKLASSYKWMSLLH